MSVGGIAAALIGCGTTDRPEEAGQTALSFKDDLGREVALPSTAERIVSLAPNMTEIVYAAGAGSQLVGVTDACDYPPPVDTLPEVSALPLNAEAVAALRPDLVLATTQVNSPKLIEMMDAIGAPVVFFSFDSVSDIFDAVRETGALAGTPSSSEAATDSLEAAWSLLRRQTLDLPDPPRVLFLIGDRTLYSFGAGSYVQDVIRAAGGRSVTAEIERAAPVLSDEFVLQQQPAVIIGAWGEEYDVRQLLDYHPTWRTLPAVENGRVYSIPPDFILRPGPRVVEGAFLMAELLHPSMFGVSMPPEDGE